MRVLHFLAELKFSGAEIMYVDAAPVFQQLGCELAVVNTLERLGEYAPFFEKAGYKVYHIPISQNYFGQWRERKKIMKLITDSKADVVHIHRSDLRWIVSYCAWRVGCRAVYTTHNVFRSRWFTKPLHILQRWTADHWFGCTFQTISDSVEANERNYYHARTALIYNWYSNRRFFPARDGEKSEIRKSLGLPQDALVIVSVGGCSHIKRHHEAIKSMAEILKKNPNSFYLHLGEGQTLDEEKQLAESLGISGNVKFYGNQTDVRKFLIASDVYVMPSRFEGIPITTIEAMGTGIPTVLYNVPGLRDFNEGGVERSLLTEENPEALASAILRLYCDKKLSSEISERAKDFVDNKFGMQANATKIYQLYLFDKNVSNSYRGSMSHCR